MTKIVPAYMSNVKLDASGKVNSYTWTRSIGVDSYGPATRLLKAGSPTSITTPTYATASTPIKYTIANATDRAAFIAAITAAGKTFTTSGNDVTVTYPAGSMYINSISSKYVIGTVYKHGAFGICYGYIISTSREGLPGCGYSSNKGGTVSCIGNRIFYIRIRSGISWCCNRSSTSF